MHDDDHHDDDNDSHNDISEAEVTDREDESSVDASEEPSFADTLGSDDSRGSDSDDDEYDSDDSFIDDDDDNIQENDNPNDTSYCDLDTKPVHPCRKSTSRRLSAIQCDIYPSKFENWQV